MSWRVPPAAAALFAAATCASLVLVAAQQPAPATTRPAAGQEPATPAAPGAESKDKKDEKPRKGLAVHEPLIVQKCAGCHFDVGGGLLSRISYLRKTPEGWELSLKRMIRMQNVQLTPDEARKIVRYLSDQHGLARSEAERAMYEVERRIHWSEESAEKDLRQSCGECHTLGRVLSERRDDQEWKLLKATHLAFFPLARWQAFAGEGGGFDGVDWESMTDAEAEAEFDRRRREPRQDQADKVLDRLAKELPLFTPDWERWQANERDVPLAGEWDVVGHEIGRGDVRGTLRLTAKGDDEYESEWTIRIGQAAELVRKGKGLIYAGCQWRGRSETKAPGEAPELRETLLLSADWNALQGRLFTGEYGEVGFDVKLERRSGSTAILAVEDGAVMIPAQGQLLDVRGAGFPADASAADFNLGEGVRVKTAERLDATHVRLTVDVERKARRGTREISFRAVRGPADVVLYDTIDYVKVSPELGLSRVGGKMRPPQLERFEALGMNRGPDDEAYTADDYAVKPVSARWTIEEFPVRDNDDDAQFVGAIDEHTGLFTPALDGPNPKRRWSANNIGDVYVVATCRLNVRELPPKPKPEKTDKKGDKKTEPPPEDDTPIRIVEKEFRARGRLLVMVPIYVDWNRYQFDRR